MDNSESTELFKLKQPQQSDSLAFFLRKTKQKKPEHSIFPSTELTLLWVMTVTSTVFLETRCVEDDSAPAAVVSATSALN